MEKIMTKCNRRCGEVSQRSLAESPAVLCNDDAVLGNFENSILTAPTLTDTVLAYHDAVLARKAFARAEAVFREALSRHPHNKRLRLLLIDLMCRQQDFHGAMPEIETAMVEFGIDDGMLPAALAVRAQVGPHAGRADGVSLCMIVKNEQRHLARCLRSAKPLVDEIIVVDTGSSDSTPDIAQIFGAKTYDFPWKNDFSKARNFSLSKATGEWILVLDADETISVNDYEEFRRILKRSQCRPDAYRIQTRNYSNQANTVGFRPNRGEFPEEEGMGWYPSDKVRLFTNDSHIRFVYPVHELVEPSLQKIQIQDCAIVVHHYGTLKISKTQEKTKNYRKLGRKKLEKGRNNPAAIKERAIQSAQLGKHSEALDFWRRFLRLQPRSAEAYLNMGTAYWNLGRYAEALSVAEKALRLDPSLKEAKFNMAYSLLLVGRGGEAKTLLERLLKEQPDYLAAEFLLCVTHACLKERVQAEGIFRKLQALPVGEYIGESFLEVTKRFLSASRIDYARRTLGAALYFGCENLEMRALFASCSAAS